MSKPQNRESEQRRSILVARPFRPPIVDVHHPHAVKDVTGRPERFRHLWWRAEIEERGKGEPHKSPFVGDQGAASCAGHFARQKPFWAVERTVVETQMLNASDEPDIALVENRSAAASGNILESRRRICDGVDNTHGLLSG